MLAVAAVLAAPHLIWLAGQSGAMDAPPLDPGPALGHAAKAAIGFLAPMWVILLLLFPRVLLPLPAATLPDRFRRLLGLHLLVLAVLIAVLAATTGVRIRTHYMFVFLLLPLFVFLRAQAAGMTPWKTDTVAGLAGVAGLAVIVGLLGKFALEPQWCDECELHLPYPDYAQQLREAGFHGQGGTLIADWHPYPLAGNFRALFPEARVLSVKHPTVVPRAIGADGPCALVWHPRPDGARRNATIGVANRALDAGIPADAPAAVMAAALVNGTQRVPMAYMVIPAGSGDCR